MKSFWLTLFGTALIFQATTVNADVGPVEAPFSTIDITEKPPPPPASDSGATDAAQDSLYVLLYSDNKNSQTWTQVNFGSCHVISKPDGSRLVKVYHGSRVHCSYFTDADCKSPNPKRPAKDVEQGWRNVSPKSVGSAHCERIQ